MTEELRVVEALSRGRRLLLLCLSRSVDMAGIWQKPDGEDMLVHAAHWLPR